MTQAQKNTLEDQLLEARETIAALTQKVVQLQSALEDKETQFRDLIRRYAKRDGQGKAQNGANKSANGSATNISSSGVSIQSNGDAAQPASSAVSPSAQNRSLTDSATQTTNSDDDFDSEDHFDAGGSRHPRNGFGLQRQVSFGFPTSPKMDSESGSSSFANDGSSHKFDRNANLRTARTMKNGSINSEASFSAVSSATSSGQPSLKHSTPSSSATGPSTPNRISSTEYVPVPIRAKETDYLSLATFASIDQAAAAQSLQSDYETDDADAATITNSSLPASSLSAQLAQNTSSQHFSMQQNRQSALPAVVPVPIPVRIDSSRRPDSLNWPPPPASNGATHRQLTSFVAPQAQSPLLATFSMTNFTANSGPTPAGAGINGNGLAGSNQRLTVAAHNGPSASVANSNSPAAQPQPLTDKQDLAMRCLDLPLAEWKAGHVMAWLELHAGLQPYSLRCAENVKSGAILNSMTDSELEQLLGIEHALHKRKLQLALAELRAGTYKPHLKVNSVTHYWTARTWLREIGLPQYAFTFEQALVDGRLLTTLSKKDMEKHLHVEKKSHQASLIRSIELLRRFSFDVQALADRRARCEYVNADLVVWTNRRLSVWLKEVDLLEFSKVEMTGLNGAYIVYEGLSVDSLCSALHIPSSKSMVRKHLEAKLRELSSTPVPASVILHTDFQSQNGFQNCNQTQSNTKVSAHGDGSANEYGNYVNAYPQEQLDYINLDANTPKATSHKSRNYVTLEGYQKETPNATRSDPRNQTSSQAMRNTMQPSLTTARPMRNAEQRGKLDDSDIPDRDHDQEKSGSKFVRSASASRSTSRKMAGLRSSLGKAFSKKSTASQPEADKAS